MVNWDDEWNKTPRSQYDVEKEREALGNWPPRFFTSLRTALVYTGMIILVMAVYIGFLKWYYR